jgi:hypothetical protein
MPALILALIYYYTKKGLPVGERVRIRILWSKFPKFVVRTVSAIRPCKF